MRHSATKRKDPLMFVNSCACYTTSDNGNTNSKTLKQVCEARWGTVITARAGKERNQSKVGAT